MLASNPDASNASAVVAAAKHASLLAIAQPPPHRPEHVGIIVGPDPLIVLGFSLCPLLRGCDGADIGLLARRNHDRGREDVFIVAVGILAVDPALEVVG